MYFLGVCSEYLGEFLGEEAVFGIYDILDMHLRILFMYLFASFYIRGKSFALLLWISCDSIGSFCQDI